MCSILITNSPSKQDSQMARRLLRRERFTELIKHTHPLDYFFPPLPRWLSISNVPFTHTRVYIYIYTKKSPKYEPKTVTIRWFFFIFFYRISHVMYMYVQVLLSCLAQEMTDRYRARICYIVRVDIGNVYPAGRARRHVLITADQ